MKKTAFIITLIMLLFALFHIFVLHDNGEFIEGDLYDEILSRGKIKVGVSKESKPFAYTNKKGEFAGAVRKVFDKITKLTGLKFNFIPVLTKEEAVQALQEGKALIDTAFDNSIQAAELYGIHVTKPYYSIPMEIITNPRVKEDISTFTYGSIDPENLEQVKSLTNILLKETNKECLDAVKKGDAKNIYLNSTVRKYLFQTDNYNKLQVAFQGDRKTTLYVGLANTAPIELYTIIEKSLLSILPSEISGYFDEASRISPPLTFSLFIKKHKKHCTLITILVFGTEQNLNMK